MRAYKNIPDVMIRYQHGQKKVWEYNNSKEVTIDLNQGMPFLVSENKTLPLKYHNIKAVVSNLMQTPRVKLIDQDLIKEMLKNPDNYDTVPRRSTPAKRHPRHSLICLSGEQWKRHRRTFSKAFDFEVVHKMIPIIQEVAKEFFDTETFENGKEPQVLKYVSVTYTWEAFPRSFFEDNLKDYPLLVNRTQKD